MEGIAAHPSYENRDEDTSSSPSSMWAISGHDFFPCERAVEALPSGHYTVEWKNGVYFHQLPVNSDDLIELPDSASEKAIKEVREFWQLEEKFKRSGFLWKRGLLLYGPAGSGKTSTVQIVCNMVVEQGGLAVYITDPALTSDGLRVLREIEPERRLTVVMEDIDAVVKNYGEKDLLALLDGEDQVDNVVFIATTNYPERLDKRMVNRPSRFDLIEKIGMPTKAARHQYLSFKSSELKNDTKKMNKWVAATKGFSVAHLKELLILVEVFGKDFNESVERLKNMMNNLPISEDGSVPDMGFRNSDEDEE